MQLFQVDAFAPRLLEGNPAAVVPLDTWLEDAHMQAIARENNLAETAFFVPEGDHFHLRWFTPTTEVDLCGHATLATAHVLFTHLGVTTPDVHFETRSGRLSVKRLEESWYEMDFPLIKYNLALEWIDPISKAIGQRVEEVAWGMDFLALVGSERAVRNVRPDLKLISELPARGLIVTAKGENSDFVSRFFAPQSGVDEDPVTGSAHCMLAPYWRNKADKNAFLAYQLSPRGGEIRCEVAGDRVKLRGKAFTYLQGTLFV